MAVICKKYRFVFLCQPRTGSKAISETLIEHGCEQIGDGHHITYGELVEEGFLASDKKLVRIVAIRNPYDSIASQYQKICSRAELWDRDRDTFEWVWQAPRFAALVTEYLEEPFDFTTFLKKQYVPNGVYNNNLKWVSQADLVLRFEHLQEDFTAALNELGVKKPPAILSINRTEQKKSYRDYYTDESRAIVAELAKDDCEAFGYTF